MISILAIFTCHNRIDKTKACISNLNTLNPEISFDYVVADDASNDGTTQFLKTLENVTIEECDGNAYYSGGMRIAITKAKKCIESNSQKYEYVLLLNDDFLCYENGISKMVFFEKKMDFRSIIAASTEGSEGRCSYSGVIKLSKLKAKYRLAITKELSDETNVNDLKSDTFNANCVLLPTDIFMELPNIDPIYVHSLGDFDYGFTATRLGYTIYATPFYVGYCEDDHEIESSWRNSSLPIKDRFMKKEHPLGQPGKQWFYFLYKNYNILTAIAYWSNDYLKILTKR